MKTRKRKTRDEFDCYVVQNEHEEHVITNALQVAAERFDDDAKQFRNLAAYLRAGNEYPMFAPGEQGAVVAERTAEQFERQAKESRELWDRIMSGDEDEDDE